MDIGMTNIILQKLSDRGFLILSFGTSFENPFEEIDGEYFNELVNEAIEEN